MTSLKPYLIRAIYQWIVDNDMSPHLLVDADNTDAVIPREFIEDGKIVLNIRPEAIQGLLLGNEDVQFNARFSGKPMHICAPLYTVLAIYAKENGKGMIFDKDEDESPPEQKPPSKPTLHVVK